MQTGGGLSLRYGDRWLYSRYQPRLVAEKAALDTPSTADTLYLLVSPCLCHGLATLAARLPPSSAVFGVDLDDRLLAIAHTGFKELKLDPNRFRLCTSTAPGTILAEASALGKFRRVTEVRLSGGRDLSPGNFDDLVKTISLNNRLSWRNRMALVRMGRLWVKNVMTNLATLPWDQVALTNVITNPIMLCGAGPSLNQVLPWIKKNARELTIMAVDTAAGALVQAGIFPDQVVCLEAQAHNLPDFTPLTGMETTLVVDISAHPASFRIVKGPKVLVSSQWMESRFLHRLSKAGLPIQTVPPLGSVGVLAARLAVQQGQIIFLAGLDFSFSRAITHCKGSPSDLAERRNETRLYKQNRNWALSFAPGVVPTAGGTLGNAILSMYASCAGLELGRATVYDLRDGFGLPLPAMALNLDQAQELLESRLDSWKQRGGNCKLQDNLRQHFPDSDKPDTQAPASLYPDSADSVPAILSEKVTVPTDAECYRTAAKAFLENELALARQLASGLRSSDKENFGALVRECDYMYAHFPDPQRVESLELDALKRLALEAGYWQNRLQMALAAVGS